MKLYTRTGDAGTTALWAGVRASKGSDRIEAIGLVDTLSAMVGIALAHDPAPVLVTHLQQVQDDLYVAGCDLMAPSLEGPGAKVPRVGSPRVTRLEGWIDDLTGATPELKNFIHPGGARSAAALHLARTGCRSAERQCHRLAADEPVNEELLRYLNRLADYLFAAARYENHHQGTTERVAAG